jgi:hypothetical protein
MAAYKMGKNHEDASGCLKELLWKIIIPCWVTELFILSRISELRSWLAYAGSIKVWMPKTS